jgi:hypothetical protein
MTDPSVLGPWIRRLLLEYLVGERHLALNTRASYRDMLVLLLPYVAAQLTKPVDRLAVADLSPEAIRRFLTHLEEHRRCCAPTRNQRLGGRPALARFIGEHSPEHVAWWAQVRLIPFKETAHPSLTYPGQAGDGCAPGHARSPDAARPAGPRPAALSLQLRGAGE